MHPKNHEKYSKLCVYWIGPFIPVVFTADIETMKIFLHQPGGNCETSYLCTYTDNYYDPSTFSFMIFANSSCTGI